MFGKIIFAKKFNTLYATKNKKVKKFLKSVLKFKNGEYTIA